MIENGYIKFVYSETEIDEDGNPKIVNEKISNFISACVEGIFNYQYQNSDSNSKNIEKNYTIYIKLGYKESNRIKVFDKRKNEIGDFWVRTRQVLNIVEEVKFTL